MFSLFKRKKVKPVKRKKVKPGQIWQLDRETEFLDEDIFYKVVEVGKKNVLIARVYKSTYGWENPTVSVKREVPINFLKTVYTLCEDT